MRELINIVKEHVKWRKQILSLAWIDLKKTYNGAALGWAWAVVKPAVRIFIYWFAFSSGLRGRAGIEGFPFFLWMLPGIIPWFYVGDILNQGTNAMRRYNHLVTKMKFPISTIPTFMNLSHLYVHIGLMVGVFVIYIASGYYPTRYWIQLPLYMFLLYLFCTGWTLFGSIIAAFSKDFLNLVRSFSMALFWLSGIMFSITKFQSRTVLDIIKCNPVTFTVEGYRNCMVHGRWFFEQPRWFCVYLAELVIMWILALWAYKKLRKDMPDVL